jgi:hypothetical protein
VNVSVKLDDRDLQRGIAGLKKKFPSAIRRAVSRTTTSVRTAASKAILADTALPSKTIKDQVKVTLSTEAGGAKIEVSGGRIPLIDFSARGPEPSRGKGRGVSYRLPGGRTRIPNAFIATMRSGHRGVFIRTGKARTPILEQFGVSLVHVFEKLLPQLADTAREALAKNLKHEISYALSKE